MNETPRPETAQNHRRIHPLHALFSASLACAGSDTPPPAPSTPAAATAELASAAVPLSPREQEVLKLIAEAFTNKQIAETLHLAEKTVESHRANLLRKLGMRDRVELVRYAIRRGLTEA